MDGWDPSEFPADHDCHEFIETALDLEAFRCSVVAEEPCGTAVNAAVNAIKEKFSGVLNDAASVECGLLARWSG